MRGLELSGKHTSLYIINIRKMIAGNGKSDKETGSIELIHMLPVC